MIKNPSLTKSLLAITTSLFALQLAAAPVLAADKTVTGYAANTTGTSSKNAICAPVDNSVPSPIDAADSQVPVAIQQLRRHILDPNFESLAFHNMDQIFTTRVVGHAGPVWDLPSNSHVMNFTYQHAGKTHPATDILDGNYTNALLIMKNGKIVTEIYRNNTNPDTRFMSWSMAKSFTSTLVGIALSEGRIKSLDDKITDYLPELSHGGYAGVTIRQILEMRSGVDYEERYDFSNPGIAARNHETSLVENVTRFADAARTIKTKYPPGQVFQYKTLDTAVLGWLVERVAGMNAASYLSSRVWEPLGAQADGFYVMDGAPGVGREFTGAGYNATLRDYARFGEMILDGGFANGHQIVPKAWVAAATSSTLLSNNPEGNYGYQWWLMPHSRAFSAIGLEGQYIYIDPTTHTVVVKLSYFPPADDDAYAEAEDFMAAASAWNPQ